MNSTLTLRPPGAAMTADPVRPSEPSAVRAIVWVAERCTACVWTCKSLRRAGVDVTVEKLADAPQIVAFAKREGMKQAPVVRLVKPDGEAIWWGGMRQDLLDEAAAMVKAVARDV